MNQLFYDIAGGIVHQIRREKRTTISEVIVRGKRNIKQTRNWFYFKFFVESSSFISQQFKCKIQFIICLVLPECLSVKICCISPSDSEANRDGADAESPFPLFFLFLPHLRTQAQGKRSENCLRFGTGGPSLCWYPLLSRNILFFPALTMAARAKKNFWRSDLLTLSPCTIGILSTPTYTEFDCAALLAML